MLAGDEVRCSRDGENINKDAASDVETNAQILSAGIDADIDRAAEILADGGLVAFPTETVYGLGARADNDVAVASIFDAKGRPMFNPLIVHCADRDVAELVGDLGEDGGRLADAFWPGPLTLVVPNRDRAQLSPLVQANKPTIALRQPAHPVARRLLSRVQVPIAAPSANPSGKLSPTTAQHVMEGLGDRIDAVLDGGPCDVGLESTIVGLFPEPRLLRHGGIPKDAVEACLGRSLNEVTTSEAPSAPGQLLSHYAPNASVRLNAEGPEEDEVMLGFGAIDGELNLSTVGDLHEAASKLFDYLRVLDALGADQIAVAPIPETGLGRAINDRLRRAAADRS